MNNRRRANLLQLVPTLEHISEQLSCYSEEEQDCLDNMPENLLESDRCVKMEENVDRLADLSEQIDSVIEEIQQIINE